MLLKALLATVAASAVVTWSGRAFSKERSMASFCQLAGAIGLAVVAFTHIAEATHILPSMRWGEPTSPGHYLDLASAVVGVALLPVGIYWRTRTKPS